MNKSPIFMLKNRVFQKGEPIPLVEFMYRPNDIYHNRVPGMEVCKVGELFPEGIKGAMLITTPGGCVFFSKGNGKWLIMHEENNLPVALHFDDIYQETKVPNKGIEAANT